MNFRDLLVASFNTPMLKASSNEAFWQPTDTSNSPLEREIPETGDDSLTVLFDWHFSGATDIFDYSHIR